MTLPLRTAVIGLGWVALHRHIPSLLRCDAFRLVGVVDHHLRRAKETATRLRLPHYAETDTLKAVPWLDEIDAVTISAPPAAHAPLILEALKCGKHVLTEKPFTLDLALGETLVTAAQQTEKTLCIVHNFQFGRAVRKLKADLAAGKLGPLRRIAATQLGNPRRRLPSWYETLPLGLFYDESPHFFYLLDRLAEGPLRLERAHAVAGKQNVNTPSLVHLLYRDAQQTPFTIDCQFDSALSEWFIRVSGEKATALVDLFRDIYIRLPNDSAHGAFDILRTSACVLTQHLWQHLPNGLALLRGRLDYGNDEVFARFARAIRTGLPDENIGPQQALDVLKLQSEAILALQQNMCP